MSSAEVDRKYLLYEVDNLPPCATFGVCTPLKQSPILLQARESKIGKPKRNFNEITTISQCSSGRTATPTGPGKTVSKSDCGRSSDASHPPNTLPSPTILIPQVLDLIRCCGRLGDEQEARRLYLAYRVGFQVYRKAYQAGRREGRA